MNKQTLIIILCFIALILFAIREHRKKIEIGFSPSQCMIVSVDGQSVQIPAASTEGRDLLGRVNELKIVP